MLIAGVLCLGVALLSAGFGLWALRSSGDDPAQQVRRMIAPTQLAAAVMLAAGGAVALLADTATGLLVVIVCVLGAVGTVSAGSWQGARYALARAEAAPADCAGSCASCTLSCH